MFDLSFLNPFSLIPDTIDKGMRDLIVILVSTQLVCFFILMAYLMYEYVLFKTGKLKVEDSSQDNDEVEEEDEKSALISKSPKESLSSEDENDKTDKFDKTDKTAEQKKKD